MTSIDLASARLVPAPGTEGWLCRSNGVVVWAPSAGSEAGELVSACFGGGGPAELLGRVGARLADPQAAPWPPFVIIAVRGPDLVAVVHGPAELTIRRDGADEVLRGGDDVGSWLHRVLHGVDIARAGKPPSSEGYSDLREGVVMASGFALLPVRSRGDAPRDLERGHAESAVGPRAAARGQEVTVVEEPVVLSSSTEPETSVAQRGQSGAAAYGTGPAGALGDAPTVMTPLSFGKLTWDNGDVHELSGPVLIGRDVSADESVVAGDLAAVTPTGQNDSMSRVHAELRPLGAEVVVVDKGSTNGTFIWDDTSRAWQRLSPGEPQKVSSGAVLAFGERTATFEGVAAAVG